MTRPGGCNNRRFRRWLSGTLLLTFYFLLSSCANIVSPTGGPKDIDPPKAVEAQPPDGSVNFNGKSVLIRFDEYFQAPTLQQDFLISPPLPSKPSFKIQGKTLRITFNDSLAPGTTFRMQFGGAIRDITEGNSMKDFSFVVSTGNHLDSLEIKGLVLNAWDEKTEENLLVMLYPDTLADSLVASTIPLQVTKPDKAGAFAFTHLPEGSYQLFAVSDRNNNLFYDLITEPFAFYPEPVVPLPSRVVVQDTLVDTAKAQPPIADIPAYKLRMFTATDSVQRILSATTEGRQKATIALRFPLKNPDIHFFNPAMDSLAIFRWNDAGDSLSIWLKSGRQDSLQVGITGVGYSDTARVAFRQITAGGRGSLKVPKVALSLSVPRGGKISPLDTPFIILSQPVIDFHQEKALLISSSDTVPLALQPAGNQPCLRYTIMNTLSEDTLYRVMLPAGSVQGWDGSLNDTMDWAFTRDGFNKFGKLKLLPRVISKTEADIMICLMDDKSVILQTRKAMGDREEIFFPLKPGNYRLKAVLDENRNGSWDTGDFSLKKQPEKVKIMQNAVNIKADWVQELQWDLNFDDY
jgi:uncharacterized protein (DUF2141 family)